MQSRSAQLRFTAPAAGVYTVLATSYEIAANNNDTIDPNADGHNTLTIVSRGVGIEELGRTNYASYVWSLPVMSTRDMAEHVRVDPAREAGPAGGGLARECLMHGEPVAGGEPCQLVAVQDVVAGPRGQQ